MKDHVWFFLNLTMLCRPPLSAKELKQSSRTLVDSLIVAGFIAAKLQLILFLSARCTDSLWRAGPAPEDVIASH